MNAGKAARLPLFGLLMLVGGMFLGASTPCIAEGTAYVVSIDGEVNPGLASYVERSIGRLSPDDLLIVRIHTFGGRVDVATEIRDAIIDAPCPTIAWVNKRAISAGALIALACNHIAMVPESSIGAVTPVDGAGAKASEKIVSYLRSEMRATAEQNGRNPEIAEAMVDESLDAGHGLDAGPGTLLTLTASEAVDVGFADTLVSELADLVPAFGYQQATFEEILISDGESVVRFLSHPVVGSILMMLGLGGVFYIVKTGSLGPIALIGVGALGLFFGGQYLAGFSTFTEMLLFAGGVLLIVLEIFVIPGFGVAGVLGFALMVAGLFLSSAAPGAFDNIDALSVPMTMISAALIGFCLLVWAMYRFLPNSSRFRRLALFGESVSASAPVQLSTADADALIGRTATVTATDVTASNGVIHVIDTVLMPQ